MQIKFSVGAKAARLIGRENIADVDGALVELIKNAYDADASCVWVDFALPFPDVPDEMEMSVFKKELSERDFVEVCKYYDLNEENLMILKSPLSEVEKSRLQDCLFSYNKIIVLDNGTGMTKDTVKKAWMYIGTSDKEENIRSDKGRIKTGAKGIGRFALDKLSKQTTMYTFTDTEKNKGLCWSVDWDQFANVKLLNEVNASLDEVRITYEQLVRKLSGQSFDQLNEYEWSSGTAFILTPIREPWSERLFSKVNTNLGSINPIGSVDKFDVIVKHEIASQYSHKSTGVSIDAGDYDYRIKISYDGDSDLCMKLQRNEVLLSRKFVTVSNEQTGETKKCNTNEFWKLPAFQKNNYRKEDYDKEIEIHKNVYALFKKERKERIREIGPFQAELYFLRIENNAYQIMKKVKSKKRRELLNQFSGVKIYRDEFKVRPYGDEGPMSDWLGMGRRQQKSPASVAHLTGTWRVQPYQMIGFVKISREKNPLLQDMANREGIALTNTYYLFVEILQECLKEFEYDRQYIYREYAKWIKDQEDSLKTKTDRVIQEALKQAGGKRTRFQDQEKKDDKQEEEKDDFTREDYLHAVYDVVQEAENELHRKQIIQILSSSGIILNTFFHEFNAINTQFHVRTSQLRSRFNYILEGKEYTGLPAYDPYKYIEGTVERNDRLTAAMLDVIMEGLKKPNLEKENVSLKKLTNKIMSQWKLLLEEKHIYVVPEQWEEEDCIYEMAAVDWYIILNNFLLNSAWFLEQEENTNRQISLSFLESDKEIDFLLENNGPVLAEKFRNSPNRIFELGETSKGDEGTGLGLWVVKETVERCNGKIEVLNKTEGFGLKIVFRK